MSKLNEIHKDLTTRSPDYWTKDAAFWMHDRLREAEEIISFHTCGPKVGMGNQCNECEWLAKLEGK